MTIGVLALQGAFAEHIDCLKKLGVSTVQIRNPDELVQYKHIYTLSLTQPYTHTRHQHTAVMYFTLL